ncbi:MAG: Na+/H+ antiporter NhaA [Cyanobacteria bacterium]|nr:Na+/H+ antiporter NhaA [Cyanobacteriota bacterium]
MPVKWIQKTKQTVRLPFQHFVESITTSSGLLVGMFLLGLVCSNSVMGQSLYRSVFTAGLTHFINDGLMSVFFLLVGLEIRREWQSGELSEPNKRRLPLITAVGGMLFPALIFCVFNPPGTPWAKGWGIPTVTDIAFSLAVLSFLKNRIPDSLRVLLTALAILDDIGAILLIALFYTSQLHVFPMAILVIGFLLFGILRTNPAFDVKRYPGIAFFGIALWTVTAIGLWVLLYQTGIHPSISGVILAWMMGTADYPDNATLEKLEESLAPWVNWLIVPVFILANTQMPLAGLLGTSSQSPLSLAPLFWGITLGLFVGKPLGIILSGTMALRLGVASLPPSVSVRHAFGAAVLAGIGFTMALFVSLLAFNDAPTLFAQELLTSKAAIFSASLASGLLGYFILALGKRSVASSNLTQGVDHLD